MLRLCESSVSWFVSAQILTMNIKRLPQGESLVHLLLKADLSTLVQFPKGLCSLQWTKRSRIHARTLRVINTKCVSHEARMVFLLCELFASIWQFYTVNNLGCGRSLSATENLFIIDKQVFSRGKWGIKLLEETPDILSIFNLPKRKTFLQEKV